MFNNTLLEQIGKKLLSRNETVSVAESVTAGLLSGSFSMVSNAMQFFQGGIVVYNLGQKAKHLHIDPIHAQSTNCVSQQIANDMALNVCKKFMSNWGIAITGYASPVPESGNKLYAYLSIVHQGKVVKEIKLTGQKEKSVDVQLQYVNETLKLLKSLFH